MDVLSDTMGVDFGPYLARVLHDVRENWYRIIPESARAPLMKKGKVSIEFAILKNGQVAGLQIVGTSGDVALDRAAYGGITASKPFPPLPPSSAASIWPYASTSTTTLKDRKFSRAVVSLRSSVVQPEFS